MLPKGTKEIPNFPGYYATPSGDIWSGPKKSYRGYRKLRGLLYAKRGSMKVELFKKGQSFWKKIHRLILETFVGSCPEGKEGCHKNDIANDNRLENLYWGTHSDNCKDAFRNGKRCNKGSNSPRSKLNKRQAQEIKKLLGASELSQRKIAKLFNVTQVTIHRINVNEHWTVR
jgi:hypothetical protein